MPWKVKYFPTWMESRLDSEGDRLAVCLAYTHLSSLSRQFFRLKYGVLDDTRHANLLMFYYNKYERLSDTLAYAYF